MMDTIQKAESAMVEEIQKILKEGVSNKNAHTLAMLVIAVKLGLQADQY